MGRHVLAEDGQGGRAFLWSYQLEKVSVFGAGRDPRALTLPGATAVTVSLLFLLLV